VQTIATQIEFDFDDAEILDDAPFEAAE